MLRKASYLQDFYYKSEAKMVTNVTLAGAGGFYASFDIEEAKLTSYSMSNDEEIEIPLPNNQQIEPIAYIAVNPENAQEIVIATYNNDIYLTKDEGFNWETLASGGELAK